MSAPRHEVSVQIGGKSIHRWIDYEIDTDMLEPADQFTMSIGPLTSELWELVELDSAIQVYLDDAPILNGFIGTRTRSASRSEGSKLEITGLDKGGRLTRESMDLIAFDQKTLGELVERCVSPWFSTVSFSNTRNRNLLRGRRTVKVPGPKIPLLDWIAGTKVSDILYPRTTTVPVDGLKTAKRAPRKVDPGQTRWAVITDWLEGSGLIAWSSGDGEEFIVGVPAYNQPAQYRFVLPAANTSPTAQHVIDWTLTENVEERYSQITVVGAVRGDSKNYGKKMIERQGIAVDGHGTHGIRGAQSGTMVGDFQYRKILIIQDDAIRSATQAKKRAEHEMALRAGSSKTLELTVRGHGQLQSTGKPPTLYCPDTIAEVVDEELGTNERWLITRCSFRSDRNSGERTALSLIPEGSEVAL